jgi:hypothetical protein
MKLCACGCGAEIPEKDNWGRTPKYKHGHHDRTEVINAKCAACDSTETYMSGKGRPLWCIHDGYRMCRKCYRKYVYNPVYNPIYNKIYHVKSIMFKDKRINVGVNPRTGKCSWCDFVGITQIHHKEYHDDDPLKDTIELCPSCHMKESIRLKQCLPYGNKFFIGYT